MKKCIVCKNPQYLIFKIKKFSYYKCKFCHHVTTYPTPTNKDLIKHYSKRFKSGNYKLLKGYSADYSNVYKQIAQILVDYMPRKRKPLNGKRILDIGCFTGDLLLIFKKFGADVYGIELQKDAVKIANKSLPKRIYEKDIMNTNLKLGKFDIVSITGLIEHVTDPVKMLNKIYKITNENGLLLIQTPNSSSILARVLNRYWPPYSPIEHINLFSKKSIFLALKESGYEPVVYKNHIKTLPISYVYRMLENFGPEIHNIAKPFGWFLDKSKLHLPFYIGEMIIIAKKINNE